MIDDGEVRDATAADAEAIARVEVATWKASYAGILPAESIAAMSVPRSAARWLRLLGLGARVGRTVLAAEHDGEVVAFASSTIGLSDARMASLDMLYVLPAYQDLGIGGALLAEIATRATHAGTTALWVEVLAKNARASRFYRHRGAIELSRTWTFWGVKPIVVVSYGWSLPNGLSRILSGR